jgi:hypothetical protein
VIRNVVVGRVRQGTPVERVYDTDPEDNRIRAELLAPIRERIERVQFRIAD